jgi:hypothetical protein
MVIIIGISASILGFILGFIAASIYKKYVGTLRIDQSDPDDSPYLFLEMSEDPRQLLSKKRVNLKVDVRNYISQK